LGIGFVIVITGISAVARPVVNNKTPNARIIKQL
jgi:hypothetical protein